MSAAEMVLGVLSGYLGLGALVAVLFAALGVGRLDPAARGLSLSNAVFRIMILPGATALWPVVLARWIAALRRPAPAQGEHP